MATIDNPKEHETDVPLTEQAVPHSGNLGLEQPVREFDNTPLSDAVDQGLISSPPDTIEQLQTPVKSPRKVPLWAKIAAPLTAAGLVGGVVAAVATNSSSEKKTNSVPIRQAVPTTLSNPEQGTVKMIEPVLPIALSRSELLNEQFQNINLALKTLNPEYLNFAFAGDPSAGLQGKDSPTGKLYGKIIENIINNRKGDLNYSVKFKVASLLQDNQYDQSSPYSLAKVIQHETGLTVGGDRVTTIYFVFGNVHQDYYGSQSSVSLGLISAQDPISESQANEFMSNPQLFQSYIPRFAR